AIIPHSPDFFCPLSAPSAASHRAAPLAGAARVMQILEEIALRIDQHHVATAVETLAVRAETAHERIEFGVLLVRVGINRRRLGITLAANLLCLFIRSRLQNGFFAV